jgi:3-methyladenine DNA glycosylase Tag
MEATQKGCTWPSGDPLMQQYHDEEWGTPLHDDQRLFEFLVLDALQAAGMINDHVVSCPRHKAVKNL